MKTTEPPPITPPTMKAGEFLTPDARSMQLNQVAGANGLDREIDSHRVQKPGLALAGFLSSLRPGRVQVLGESEINYLAQLVQKRRDNAIRAFCRRRPATIIITKGLESPAVLLRAADRHQVPTFRTPLVSSALIESVQRFLEGRLSQRIRIHAGLLDLYGLGVLILGESGVGKSELALELIARGHRLVSDDIVEIHRRGEILAGVGPELTRYHMELRGIGIINIKDLFGVAAVRYLKDIELVVKLDPWRRGKNYERLGLEERTHELLGVSLPFIEMPIAPGRNLAILLEVAARNLLLKRKGYHPARELVGRLKRNLAAARSDPASAAGDRRRRGDSAG